MALPLKKESYTFADCLTWPENERIELIDGEAVMMSLPSTVHQKISGELFRQLANFLEGKKCEVFSAPFGVRLFEKDGDSPENVDTMVEPDISVICDRDKLDRHGCKGAPDLIVEILSPSTQRRDRLIKLELYQRAGVREYWLVSPEEQTVQVLLFTNGLLLPRELYKKGDVAKVNVLEGCFLELEKVFPGP
ncbi:MAG: Uma2 family endonuclease [Oscillospiraceae bacterium]|nr:Uma2 family endonuclease [Oscillospiraceae bacterium]MCI9581138.1 Uma2 family endonuclease [Oscillospiraceae bacterium]